jgi:hypothetical protein
MITSFYSRALATPITVAVASSVDAKTSIDVLPLLSIL